jgi:hypothetical protein
MFLSYSCFGLVETTRRVVSTRSRRVVSTACGIGVAGRTVTVRVVSGNRWKK